ncbi:MAG: nucleoside triphosphate pyrophosphohydrolase [Spirochaetales bacterium]|nr:nucleoside triphosphate pyrophosphohydrolase [Spirochaetales bacterium]
MFDKESSYEELYKIIKYLRSDKGCPWDRKQTALSMRPSLIEETYECIDAIDAHDTEHVAEEIGDIFLILTMLISVYEESDHFKKSDVFRTICDKMVRRHPHVFSDLQVDNADDVVKKWDEIKEKVEGRKTKKYLDTVPMGIPPLERAYSLQKKAAKVGFDWDDPKDVFAKLREEIDELEETFTLDESEERKYEELGDTIFSLINVGRFLKLDPALALHGTNRKFYNRFGYMEEKMELEGTSLSKANFDRMDTLWDEAKQKGIK